jgi:hypothetical protein
MTRWGVILLVLFFVLGLTDVSRGRAIALAVCLTAIVLTGVMAQYMQ